MQELSTSRNHRTTPQSLARGTSMDSWVESSSSEAATLARSFFETAICPACERELFDPHNRRYLYPFINCNGCGSYFSTSGDISCDDCRAEYENPRERRFHTQPVACSKCGPFVTLWASHANISTIEYRLSAILRTRRLLREGGIVAVKSLSGFHIVCDVNNPVAVAQLQRCMNHAEKPFVVMAADLAAAENKFIISNQEKDLLSSREKPIVPLNQKRSESAPTIVFGTLLPRTPLHHLLLNQIDPILTREPAPSLLAITNCDFSEESATIEVDALLTGSNQVSWSK